MFKSIENKLSLNLLLLILSTGLATYFFISTSWVYCGLCIFIIFVSLSQIYQHYNKFNLNILFLLNALDNGDYSFNFAETKLSRREKELNIMMNRIKTILSNARKEVIENEKFLSLIVESVPIGIVIMDEKNNIRQTNQAVNKLLGLPVFTHINQLRILDPSFPTLFKNLTVGKENIHVKVVNEREENLISIQTSQITLKDNKLRIITLTNIGNELEAKEMESWIRLIRVMTHEIMNSIAPITSLTNMLLHSYKKQEVKQEDTLRENTIGALSTINTTAVELTTFVDSYREFSGVSKPQLSTVELKPLLHSIAQLELAEMAKRNISVSIIPTDFDITINIDRSQISQILVNLLKNAIEAIELDEGEIKIFANIDNEKQVRIDVANNGTPIPSDVLASIFIPFFTTKKMGSGIGLSVSRYIMRLHGGNLKHHYSDGWTIFSLVF